MLNLLEKKPSKIYVNKLDIKEIEKFYSGNKNEILVGLEYERLSLDKNTLKNASYEKLEKIISHFCELMKWELLFDKDVVINVRNDVVELQQRMLLLTNKNNSLSKEKYELEMQIPHLHNDNADIQSKLLEIPRFIKALNEEIKETENRMNHKKH